MATCECVYEKNNNQAPKFLLIILVLFVFGVVILSTQTLITTRPPTPADFDWTLQREVGIGLPTYVQDSGWVEMPVNIPDLFDPSGFCQEHGITELTGSPCRWVKEFTYMSDGRMVVRHRLMSGDYKIAEVQAGEFSLDDAVELASSPKITASFDYGWLESIDVAAWARSLGLGKMVYHAFNNWLVNFNNGPVVRFVMNSSQYADTWVTKYVTEGIQSGAYELISKVTDNFWVLLMH